jgi:hypothetical protein
LHASFSPWPSSISSFAHDWALQEFQPIQHVRVQDLHIQSPLEHAAEELLDNWSDARIASVAPAAADQMQFHIIPATAQKYPDMTSAFYLAILMEYLANVISRSFLETP